ncbi:MAG: hypothetical protein V9E81_06080 [Marmoricola sp.]
MRTRRHCAAGVASGGVAAVVDSRRGVDFLPIAAQEASTLGMLIARCLKAPRM